MTRKELEITVGEVHELIGLARQLPTFDLGSGFIFTVKEILDFEVDYTTEPNKILLQRGLDPSNWGYLGKKRPEPRTRMVKAAIGCLNRDWFEEQVAELLAKPNCPLKGSGAWVRESFCAVRPFYDGRDWIGFPDSETSRWRSRSTYRVCFPCLWDDEDNEDYWGLGMDCTRRVWVAEERLCLLLVE